ncbi:hypothetical protein [Acinetobacter sp.]|uniref:DUF7940 domain-containing protein n=1 Tax=Acinetobacter sp. TaxID=472 RepID=UPI0028A7EC1D|nr:hypothetical protein [Acinetobacter sp.]
MKKTNRKVPQSVKVKRRIDTAVEQAVADKKRFYDGVISRREQKYLTELTALQNQVNAQPLAFIAPENRGLVVANWRNWWKWWSARGLALIAFLAITPIPPELLVLLPDHIRMYAIAVTAVCAFMMNFIDQKHDLTQKTKGVQSWSLKS